MTVVQPRLAPPRIVSDQAPDGSRILRSEMALEPYEASLGVLLRRWAEEAPDRVFLAERPGDGDWVELTWGDANRKATAIAQALLDRDLGPDRPLMILSGNSIDHALLTLGGFLAGVPVVPVSPAYSLMSQDYGKVKHIAALVKPGLVYAADAGPFGGVLSAVDFGGAEIVLSKGTGATPFRALLDDGRRPGPSTRRWPSVGPDSLAKVLFTSGSTALPKGVLNTHGMLCANQQSLAQIWPFTAETPPVLVDWLPWNHTFGGNHNFNLILKRGGTLYIDAGRPAPPLIPITVRNLTEIAPTIYFNVPAGYGALLPFLERDENLRARFFERLDLIFYAAAALPQDLWTRLEAVSRGPRRAGDDDLLVGPDRDVAAGHRGALPDRPRGRDRRAGAGRGDQAHAGRGQARDARQGAERHARLPRGARADREGVRRGRLVPHRRRGPARGRGRPEQGPRVQRPRGRGLQAHHGHVRVGRQPADRGAGGGLAAADGRRRLRPRPRLRRRCWRGRTSARRRSSRASRTPSPEELVRSPKLAEFVRERFIAYNRSNPASSTRVERVILLAEPPSLDANEITDKGYVNQRAALERRAVHVAALFAETPGEEVIICR